MNFLCHALPYLDQPVLAGCTGIPDWLSVIDRKVRARGRYAEPHRDADDPLMRELARGILAHLKDDRWFHGGATFTRLTLEFAVVLRDILTSDKGFRPSIVAHILIEMLLDSHFVEDRPDLVQRYYEIIEQLPAEPIADRLRVLTGKPVDRLPETITRFAKSQFLLDYPDDEKLLRRINQVLGRVGLKPLPSHVLAWLPAARKQVRRSHEELLMDASPATPFPRLRSNAA